MELSKFNTSLLPLVSEVILSFCNSKGCSSGKGLGIGGISIKSKVHILLVPNNSLGDQPAGEVGILPDSCGWGALYESEVYPIWVHKVLCHIGIPCHKNKINK
jgi:hypothetical protein